MKLYYMPGSCALAPHIALEQACIAYGAIRVERGSQVSPGYLAVNPLGRVPALATDDGAVLTEVPAILNLIADRAPGSRLLPEVAAPTRYEVLRWLAFLSSTVHPAFGRLWRPERSGSPDCARSVEDHARSDLAHAFRHIDDALRRTPFLAGDRLTVADIYLFVFGRWGLRLDPATDAFERFHRHTVMMADLPASRSAMRMQGITLRGPASGPG